MSSCQGELPQTKFNVKAIDQSGNIASDMPIYSQKNGFIELWLPRDRTINLTIEGLNRSVSGIITTSDGSNTCITTMQLQ